MPCMQATQLYSAPEAAAAANACLLPQASCRHFAISSWLWMQGPVDALGTPVPDPQMVTFREAVLLPPNGTNEGGGSVQLPGLVPLGTVLAAAADNLQPSQAACCAACRADIRCNVYWYCETQARTAG